MQNSPNTSPRLAFVVPFLANGGAERAMINIASSLFRRGIPVTLAAATRFGGSEPGLPDGMEVFDLMNNEPLDSPRLIHNSKILLRFIKKHKPDVVFSTSDYLNTSLILARTLSKHSFKIIIAQQIHASAYHRELPVKNRLFLKRLQHFIANRADLLICSSNGVAEDYGKLYLSKKRRSKIRTIYNPIFEPRILSLANEPARILENPDIIKLITVGRLVKQKDHQTLFHAFKWVALQNPKARLFIIGTGPEEKNLQALAQELHLTEKITFLGYQANPYRFVANADLFVLSSEYEGFGNVIVEALAVGTNVVTTDCPSGPAEILDNGRFGTLCATKNPEALSKAILHALDNPYPKDLLQERARAFASAALLQRSL